MFDDSGAENGDEFLLEDNENGEKSLLDFVPAGLIFVLAMMIVGALFQKSPEIVNADQTSKAEADVTTLEEMPATADSQDSVVRFGVGFPLRSALREISADRTGTIQETPPVTAAVESVTPHDRATRSVRKSKPTPSFNAEQRTKTVASPKTSPKENNPLTVVGRTAGAMATRFASDLRALPSQISSLFRSPSNQSASAAR